MDRERISRLEALLARVKARGDEPRTHPNGDAAHAAAGEEEASAHDHANGHANGEIQHDSILPPESSTLHALPPPPPGSSGAAFVAPRSEPEMAVRSSELEFVASEPEPYAGELEPEPALELEPLSDRAPAPSPRPEVSVPTRPAFMPLNVAEATAQRRPATPPPAAVPPAGISASSLEEAFEQYELVSEVVEIAPDAEDDSVRPSQRPPVMIDSEFDENARRHEEELRAATPSDDGELEAPEEMQSQQRLVVAAPSSYPPHGADSGELEVVGEAEIDEVIDPETSELVLRDVEDLPSSHRPTREMSAILETGFDAPPENANRPVLELQHEAEEDIEEPPPSSRRPVSHEEVREAELTFDNDIPAPPLTPPPESGRQVAVPVHADLRGNPEVAELVGAPIAPAVTFGELLEETLKL